MAARDNVYLILSLLTTTFPLEQYEVRPYNDVSHLRSATEWSENLVDISRAQMVMDKLNASLIFVLETD